MGKYRFESKLRNRGEEFIRSLTRGGIEADIIEESFREYSVKLSISSNGASHGRTILYYSPKSDSFLLNTQEVTDPSIASQLTRIWSEENSVPEETGSNYEIYVDGSFINGATGYGAVILRNGKLVTELCGAVDASEVSNTRQVAGELIAAKEALKWCIENSVNVVSIYYDYLGIEKWATGQWKTNQPLTREYAAFVKACPIRIRWHKVESHTGDRWNDRADMLAKKGAGFVQPGSLRSDFVDELLGNAGAFVDTLAVNGIEARVEKVYNDQFVRIFLLKDDRPVGVFDLYNTKKRRLSPYVHDVHDESLKLRIEKLWSEFRSMRGI